MSINFLFSQNLIHNGDFEIYDVCPNAISLPTDLQIEHCLGWYSPTTGTSDYFNACDIDVVSVPNNSVGYQVPFSGNAYIGLIPIYNVANDFGFWSEYVQTKLVSPLVNNKTYEFSFYINVANYNNDYALNSFGAYFSKQAIAKSDFKPFTNILPQVKYTENSFISDTINWINIKGEFKAEGGEEYLTIGFFGDTLNFDTLCNYIDFPCDFSQFVTYYYVDNCQLVEKENQIIIPNIFTPNNDGENDIFYLDFDFNYIEIYNRWGNKIFENDNVLWQGTTNEGKKASDGTYFYIIRTDKNIYRGIIQLLR